MGQAQLKETDLHSRSIDWLVDFQQRVCDKFEEIDGKGKFEVTDWQKTPEDTLQGHGSMRLMKGQVFEKVGVNFSNVWGTFEEKFAREIPGAMENGGHFKATGVSLVAHMCSPLVPAVHMNLRHIETSKGWFGGGADLTPYFPYDEDTQSFHAHLKKACDGYDGDVYSKFKAWCDEYFFLPHRNEPRGVGGIFFDYLEDTPEEDFAFVQAVGDAFLDAYSEIVNRRKYEQWSHAQREHQLIRRGRYVEFNLLYDRGTKFGFSTGGNTEAILMSMPPEVKWP